MRKFRFTATDATGNPVQGELSAADLAAAREQLLSRDLQQIDLTSDDGEPAMEVLSSGHAEELVVALAEVADNELPLADGLRAAAAECSSRRVRDALREMADDAERGLSMQSIMSERGDFLPRHIRGLVAAGLRTNQLALALDELVEHHRTIREMRREIISSFAYPLFVLGATTLLLALATFLIVPQFEDVFLDADIKLAPASVILVQASRGINSLVLGPYRWFTLIGVVTLCLAVVATWQRVGIAGRQALAASMPLLGPMWNWSGSAAFARLLATLLEHDVPLPSALFLVSDGIPFRAIANTSAALAQGASQGRSLSEMLAESRRLPASIVPFIRWGEKTGQLPQALRTINQMLIQRIRTRASIVQAIGPPVVFVVLGLVVGFVVVALFGPLISLIQTLSS